MKAIPREVEIKRPITWSREIRELQKSSKLTPFQKEVLVGSLLGDGHLSANAYGKNYRFQVVHMKEHKGYVDWKYEIFKNWCISKPKFQEINNSWRFRTISHPTLTEFHKLFYRGTKKILPYELDKILESPITLAIWFMDDGSVGPGHRGLTLNTQNFTREENERLMNYFADSFKFRVSLHKDKKSWRLYIFPGSSLEFKRRIDEFVLPEFKYKFLYL